jgi:DNA-binding NarL/FixJ family response regulator
MPRQHTFNEWLIVLQLYVEGKTIHEIAALTYKSCHTVEAYLKHIIAFTQAPHITAAYREMLLRGHIKLL